VSGDLPHSLDDARHVDLERRSLEPWMRRLVLVVLAGMVTAALLNTFGQTSVVTSAAVPSAELRVRAPEHVRGGLFFQARIEVLARDRIPAPRLLLDEGWSEELQLNTIEPAPVEESSADGRIELAYGPLEAGQRLKVWLQFEANPTGAGRRSQDVELRNGDTTVTSVTRDITVFP
jgi:hypothetical protein